MKKVIMDIHYFRYTEAIRALDGLQELSNFWIGNAKIENLYKSDYEMLERVISKLKNFTGGLSLDELENEVLRLKSEA